MFRTCPGTSDLIRPKLTLRECPQCGDDVEFWEQETYAECPSCGKGLYREVSPSCITWCQYASKCIDDMLEKKLITRQRAEELKKIAKGGE